jgi:agmatinase
MNKDFDPSGYAVKNGNFIGLPFDEFSAKIVLQPVPWEATVSYAAGTAQGPENILEASYQLDLYDADLPEAYKVGIFMRKVDPMIEELSLKTREMAKQHIDHLEEGLGSNPKLVEAVNSNSQKVNNWVERQCTELLDAGKIVGLIGGEHSTPLGYLKALAQKHDSFGILQIDAHCDLREAYEDFQYSHASIFYNALEEVSKIEKLVQVGIRDYCQEEVDYIKASKGRVEVLYDRDMQEALFRGSTFHDICMSVVNQLPQLVYISFDIDGLMPTLCPNTGTPVPGGLDLPQAFYLLKLVVESGRKIIGFDLSEVGSATEWDGNVGARVVYKLCNLMAKSQLV